jgi:choline dehydrogenase-like flavoprotein
MIERCDIAVIGSGPGGAVTACLLAEHGRDALLLEEGPNLPQESSPPFSMDEMEQKYRAGGMTVALGSPKINYVEGCCAGGGSEINSGLYHRTPPETLDLWRTEFGLAGAAPEDMAPHFRAVEEELGVTLSLEEPPPAASKLAFGAHRLQWKAMEVPRWFRQGQRQSMTRTYLARALAAGCRFLPSTRATKLKHTGDGWEIVAGESTVLAKTVFLAAGAIQTPFLLRRSGIKGNIGNTLAMHPTVKVVALFDEEVNHETLGVPPHQVKEFAPRISMGCSISSPPYLALAMLDHPEDRDEVPRNWRHMAIYYAMITGPAAGTIRVLPGAADPLIRYPLSEGDLRDLAAGLRHLCRLLFAAGARELYPSVAGVPPLRSEADLDSLPATLPRARTSLMTIHLFSSCPCGEGRGSAADSFGAVRGAPGLYINDASLLPSAPGVNPQGSVMAFARRNTLRYLGKL